MKRLPSLLFSILLVMALAACAPKGPPTPSVADLQATALAQAQTQIALTLAAVPTATLPPTAFPTPMPLLPTEAPVETATAAPAAELAPALPVVSSPTEGEANPCAEPLSKMKGPQVEITFNNKTNGDLSLYLYSYITPFGCGTGNVTLEPNGSTVMEVPKGCYDFYGWISGPKDSTPAGYGCLNFDQRINIRPHDLVFVDQL